MSIENIKRKAQAIIAGNNPNVIKAYLLENLDREPDGSELNRTCGAPIGVDERNWPIAEGEKMAHAITLDLESVPALQANFPAGTRAVAVFVSDLMENEAFEPGNPETAVVLLTEADIAKGVAEWDAADEAGSTSFAAHEIDLPVDVFSEEIYELDETDPVYELSEELNRFALAGGKPLWLQGPEHDGEIILQFDEELVDMNLGDAGVMYVFRDTAFWQCH